MSHAAVKRSSVANARTFVHRDLKPANVLAADLDRTLCARPGDVQQLVRDAREAEGGPTPSWVYAARESA